MAQRQKITTPKRGEIWIVNFDPTVGSEIKKTRPALIVQNNVANQYSPVTIVAAITTYKDGKLYPTEVLISSPDGGLESDSIVLLNQIRTIDKRRLIRKLGSVEKDTIQKVEQALEISLGLIEI